MGMISFFRTPKPKQFNYRPVFYDARKEALKEREQLIKQEMGLADSNETRLSRIKGQFRGQIRNNKKQLAASNIRFVLILIGLLLLAYFLFYR